MRPVFFLRHFNDIDHIAPIIWHCLEAGGEVHAYLLDRNYGSSSDPRLQFLAEYDGFQLAYADSLLGIPMAKPMFALDPENSKKPTNTVFEYGRRGLQKSGLAARLAERALRDIDPTACVFEWGSPYRLSHREFYEAASALDIPTICLPHGLNIYLNDDIHPSRTAAFEQSETPMASRSEYDAYVTQSEYDRDQEGRLGLDPSGHYVLGSARYYPEWQAINEGLYTPYEGTGTDTERLNVVFMLPHWAYNVDEETTLELIADIADCEWAQLVVKEHTRGDSLPQELDDRLVRQENTAVVADVSSVSLIQWADAVINFGSSIGIEALQQEKRLVNPSYLHSNTTIFDETGAGHRPESNAETIATLERISDDDLDPVPEANKEALYETVVYGGEEPHDVLAAYRAFIRDIANAQP